MRVPALPAALLGAAAALSACTSTQDVLEPSALLGNDTTQPPAQTEFPIAQPGQQPATGGQPATTAAIAANTRVHFAPVIGATPEASSPLASRIAARAGAVGIGLAQAGDGSTTHVMRGYFSAISDNGETTVIYVWDVLDPAGTRIHRIQGQARTPSRGGEGWASVPPATMESIADQTVDEFAAWLAARAG